MNANILLKAGLLLLAGLISAPAEASILTPGAPQSGNFVLGPTSPGKWGPDAMGTGATVTWSLMGAVSMAGDVSEDSLALSEFMPADFFKAEIERAFDAWSAVADITFVEVADSGEGFNWPGESGEIRLGGHTFDGAGGTLAHGFFPPFNGGSAAGDIHFDVAENWKIGYEGPGFDVFWVAAHEIGHAIGLGHASEAGSLMSSYYSQAISGLQPDDIAGVQSIYGAAVPEPSTFVVWSLLAGFGLTLAWRRRSGRGTV